MSRSRARVAAATLVCIAALPASAKVFHSRSEAIELAFPNADRVEKSTFVLDAAQSAEVERRSRAPLDSKLFTLYTGYGADDEVLGYAHIDVHRVRTLNEALLVVLEPDGSVRSLRVLAFHEPDEYRTSDAWLRQFEGKTREDRLRVARDVHAISGATLSTRAVARAVRRTLALFDLLVRETGGE